jgi:hypothetical protein
MAIGHGANVRQSHGGIAEDHVIASVIVGYPHAGQRQFIGLSAKPDFLELSIQVGRQLRIPFVEVFHGRPDRMTFHEPFQSALENLQLLA